MSNGLQVAGATALLLEVERTTAGGEGIVLEGVSVKVVADPGVPSGLTSVGRLGEGPVGVDILLQGYTISVSFKQMGFQSILMLSAVEVFGDFNFRWYAQTNKPVYFGGGILGYLAVIYFLIQSLRTDNVLYVNGMWDGTSALIESLTAYLVLGDRLEHTSNYLGLALVVAGIFLLKH